MRLSAEMYEQIVASLKSDSHRDRDKRREPRVGMAAEAEYVTVSETGKRLAGTVRVRDVSATGVGLSSPTEFEKHQRFVLQLYNAAQEPLWLVCKTAHCRKVDGERYSVGAKIEQTLRAHQIQKMEARSAAAAAPARRQPAGKTEDVARVSKAVLS